MPTYWKADTVWNKKPKAKKASNPEDACWRAFSLYIRTRDGLRTVGSAIAAKCVTCSEIVPTKGNDAGHFVTRSVGAIKYDPRNCHLQCVKCNRFQQGNWDKYMDFMLGFYDAGIVQELLGMRHVIQKGLTDWNKEAAKWKERKRALEAFAQKSESKVALREVIRYRMKSGTLEHYLDNIFPWQ